MIKEYNDALDFCEQMTERARQMTAQMQEVTAEQLGLDPRSFWGYAYVDASAIVVIKEQARDLNYYGGFEYVDADSYREVGDYVFYLASDDRVKRHIERVMIIEDEL
jgi:hypothetical protein